MNGSGSGRGLPCNPGNFAFWGGSLPITPRTPSTARCGLRPGFTLLEILLVLVIGAIVASYGVPRIGQAFDTRAVVDGRDAISWFAARARATALQSGVVTRLEVDPGSERIEVRMLDADSTVVDWRDLSAEYGVDVSTGGGSTVYVCYSPRGWALVSSCSAGLPADISVVRNDQQADVEIRALGQVVRS